MTNLEHHRISVRDVNLHVVTAGQGEPVVLLHGWPQTWYEWRDVIPTLAEHYTVIAPDLRGLGDSARTEGGYDKQNLAEDIYALVKHLGHERVRLVGHDWGGIIAYHYAALHESEVARLVILDVGLPTAFDGLPLLMQPINPAWHFAFHNVPGLPEQLLTGKEEVYLRWWFQNAVPEEAVQEYVRAYAQPGAMSTSLAYYRTIFEDIENVKRLAERKLNVPVLAVGGAFGFGGMVEQSLRTAANDVRGVVMPNTGHWVTEQQPREVAALLLEFLA